MKKDVYSVRRLNIRASPLTTRKRGVSLGGKPSNGVYAVIMAGGKGERFWPESRFATPKQLLSIVGKRSMLQETVARVKPLINLKNILIITRAPLGKAVKRQLPGVPPRNIVIEPVGRDTAACIGLAAILARGEDPVLVVLPADHIITPRNKFLCILKKAIQLAAKENVLITLGIQPAYPATGYGYIKIKSEVRSPKSKVKVYGVERFTEKPDKRTAERFVQSGNYFWNSGMFIWRKSVILSAIGKYMPSLYRGLEQILLKKKSIAQVYPILEKISIDYGVMEKAKNTVVIKTDFSWNDLGSWESLEDFFPHDAKGNILVGKTVLLDTQKCLIINRDPKRLIAGIGLANFAITSTPKATLIFPKGKGQQVKKLVHQLAKDKKLQKYK